MALSQQAFGSPALMEQLAQLDANLQSLRPGEDWSGSEGFDGEQGLGLGDGTGVLQDLADLDELAEQLVADLRRRPDGRPRPRQAVPPARQRRGGRRAHPPAAGAGAARQRLPQAQQRRPAQAVTQGDAPARQGAAARRGDRGCPAGRASATLRQAGAAGERSGATRSWEFGDTEPWDVHAHDHQRRPAGASPRAATRGRRTPPHRRRRGDRDRGAHPGVRGAAGRHVVLDGDGRPLGADEAHRARAAHADPVAVPRRRAPADQLRRATPR